MKIEAPEDAHRLTLRLFGPFEARVNGVTLSPLRSHKGRWLLALLALRSGRDLSRAWLAETLWPDSLSSEGLTSLRQSLADLRRVLGAASCLIETPDIKTLRLDPGRADIDVVEFDHAIASGDHDALRRAVTLCRGPLLEGCAETWALQERETRQRDCMNALEILAARAVAAASYAEGIDLLLRGAQIDPLHEPLQRALMSAYEKSGDPSRAVEIYQAMRHRLFDALRMEPQPETQTLYREIRARVARHAQRAPVAQETTERHASDCHVPYPLTEMVGRAFDTTEIIARLMTARLVTLTGTGGVGKTRLAIHVAQALASDYCDGACFVDLSVLSEPALVPQTAGAALGAQEERGRSWTQTLVTFLTTRQLLLVLDNCEHLSEACADLARALLTSCSGLRILATSRQRMGLVGESVWTVEGLSLPARGGALRMETLAASEAVRLFTARAAAARPGFALDALNAPAVARICRHLDGLPFALELAAARIESMTADEIAERLESASGLLVSDDPTQPRRHQDLRAIMDWSYALLAPTERTLLRRLSVFAGGWTLDAAEMICEDAGPEVSRLVSRSLALAEDRGGRTRYRLLETVRRYARARLEASGEAALIRKRHSEYYLRLAEEIRPAGAESSDRLERLEAEHDNLRAVLDDDDPDGAALRLRLATTLGRFWQIRGYLSEGRYWLSRALTASVAATPERAEALNRAGLLACYQGDLAAAQRLADEGATLWEALGEARGLSVSLGCLGIVAADRGDLDEAEMLHRRSLACARQANDPYEIASALGYLGIIASNRDDHEAAQRHYEESLMLRRGIGDTWGIAASLNNLGLLARSRGELAAARDLLEQSLAIRRRLGDRRSLAITLNVLGLIACQREDPMAARALLKEGIEICRTLGDRRNVAYALEAFADLAIAQRRPERAVTLLEAAAALRSALGSPLPPTGQPHRDQRAQRLRAALGQDDHRFQSETGRAMTVDLAIDYALDDRLSEHQGETL